MRMKIQVEQKDLYCMARLLQSSLYGPNAIYGCLTCKFKCSTDVSFPNFEKVLFRLQDLTGVDMSIYQIPFEERFKNEKSHCWDSDF